MSQPPPDPRDPWADPPPYGSAPYGSAPYGSTPPGSTPPASPGPYLGQHQGLPPGQQPPPPYRVQGPYPGQGQYPAQYPGPAPYPAQPPAGPPPPGAWPGYGPQPYGAPGGYYAEKTKAAAGLLQLLPGFFLAIGGIGRCYSGHVALGVTHLVLSIIGWLLTPLYIGIPMVIGCWLWAVIDGIVLLAGRPTDPYGRLLR